MTKEEFDYWIEETEKSTLHWQKDSISEHNRGCILLYKGGEDGNFIVIDNTGKVKIGTYVGACPHIGEALFEPQYTAQYKSKEEAVAKLKSYFMKRMDLLTYQTISN